MLNQAILKKLCVLADPFSDETLGALFADLQEAGADSLRAQGSLQQRVARRDVGRAFDLLASILYGSPA